MRKNKFHTINEYINTFPKDVQIILDKISQTIRKAAPEAIEAISYGIPTFNGTPLVHPIWYNYKDEKFLAIHMKPSRIY
jgi:uncharacterized protein YdhG (YjbR/CyaY superfamily)